MSEATKTKSRGRPKMTEKQKAEAKRKREEKKAQALLAEQQQIENKVEKTKSEEVDENYSIKNEEPDVIAKLESVSDIIRGFPSNRDERGLLKDVDYKFKEDGSVDWRAMVPDEFIVLNAEKCAKDGVDISILTEEQVDELKKTTDDGNLLILLAGYRELARLRGYSHAAPKYQGISESSAVVEYFIEWIPNFESGGSHVSTGGLGNANFGNTEGIFSNFLEPIAENRAFVRTVRSFLNVNILGADEIKNNKPVTPKNSSPAKTPTSKKEYGSSAKSALEKYLNERKISFDQLKDNLVKSSYEGAESWNAIGDIPDKSALVILEKLKAKAKG